LPNGLRRSVPCAATDIDQPEFALNRQGLPFVSVRTILPVARFVRSLARTTEEKNHEQAIHQFGSSQLAGDLGGGSEEQEHSASMGSTEPKIPKTTGSATGKNDPAIQADSAPGEEQQ